MPFTQGTQQGMRSTGPTALRRDNNVRIQGYFHAARIVSYHQRYYVRISSDNVSWLWMLTRYQNLYALRNGLLGLVSQNAVVIIADRVRDNGEREVRHTGGAGHGFGGGGEAVGHDGGGGDAGFVGGDGVMQTA